MTRFYKRLLMLIAFVLIISGAVIYCTVDINTLSNLTLFQPWSLALAVLCLATGLLLDGSRLVHLVNVAQERISLSHTVQIVFGNYFLALLTPGGTGGAVAQVMFLRKAGVPTGKATVVVFVRTAITILFLLLCLPIIFLQDVSVIPDVSNDTLGVVSVLVILTVIAFGFALRANLITNLVARIARRLSLPKRRTFVRVYRDTQQAVQLLGTSPRTLFVVCVESGVSLLSIYAMVPCLLLGLGVMDADWSAVMGRMIFLNLLLYFMPTPGGSGIAEGGFVLLFSDIAPAGTVGIIAVCWRLLAEYVPFLIGFFYTVKVFGADFLRNGKISDAVQQ